MPAAAIAIPAIIGLIGAKKQADAQKQASQTAANASAYRPYDTNAPGGSVDFGPDQQVSASFSQGNQDIYGQLQGLVGGLLGGQSSTSGFQDFANSLGNGGIQGLFGNALSQSGQTPDMQYLSSLSQLGGLSGQNQSALGGTINSLGQNPYGDISSSFMNQGQSLLGQGTGLQGNAMNFASPFINQAQGLAGQDQSSLINNNLNLLRQQAAPQEQSQFTNLQDTLFGQGRLGAGANGPGMNGANPEMQALFNSFGQNDLNRQIASNQLGLQAQQQNLSSANFLGNLGLNYGGLANQTGSNLNSAGQGFLGLGTQLSGMGDSRMLGLLGQIPGLINGGSNLATQGYNTASNYSDLLNSRAQQGLSNASGLFGMGNSLGQQDFGNALNALTGTQNMDASLRNLINLGGTLGQQGANAGANQAQAYLANSGSPLGAFMSGAGQGLLQQGMNNYGSKNIQPVSGSIWNQDGPYSGY